MEPTPETDRNTYNSHQDICPADVVPALICRRIERDRDKWKKAIIPFLAVHAAQYGKERFGEGCMIDSHYDLLKDAGARIDDFTRCETQSLENEQVEARRQ